MKKTYLILLTGLLSGLAINRAAAQDEAVVEPIEVTDHCAGIGIIPILPDADGGAVVGEEATSGEATAEPSGEAKEEPVDVKEEAEVKDVEVKDGEAVCPEIYYMTGGPLPYQRGESASGPETGADRDEAEEAPAPKFARKSITDLVKKSTKPSAVKKNGRVFLRR